MTIPLRSPRRRPRTAERARPGAIAVTTVLLALLLAAACVPWWLTYESGAFLVAVGVALAAGLGLGVAGAVRRWPAWLVVSSTAAAFLVLGVPAAVPDLAIAGVLPTPEGLVELVTATWASWKQLVTVSVPVGSYQALLVPPFLLVLVAAVGAATLGMRTRAPAAAVLPPAGVLVVGIVLGAVRAPFAVPSGALFLVAAIAWLVHVAIVRRRAIGAEARGEAALVDARRVVGAAAMLAIALAGATAAAWAVPTPARTVVRSEVQPPFVPRDALSPLAAFRTAFDPDVADRDMLAVAGLPAGAGLRIAVLDTYDGVIYSVGGEGAAGLSGRFARLPYRLDQSAVAGDEVALAVRIEDYDDVWVPGIGRLERIEFEGTGAAAATEGFVYNDVTGTAAIGSGMLSGSRYRAWSVAPVAVSDLAGFVPGTSVLPAMPALPTELVTRLETWAPSTLEPGARLQALIAAIRAEGYVSHGRPDDAPSRAGHSLDRLVELVDTRPMVGDGEQYAVLAALLAREIGFPARVVVGYLPDPVEDAVPAERRIRSDDLQAWIEVETADGAWQQVDPNPTSEDVPDREPDQPEPVTRPQTAVPPPEPRTPVEELDDEPGRGPDPDAEPADPWPAIAARIAGIVGVVTVGVAVLLSPFAAIVLAKARRRRIRRTAPTAVERVEGAWSEFADVAADFGYPVRATATRAEQAAAVGGLLPLALAAAVDRAVYAPDRADGSDGEIWDAVGRLHDGFAGERSRLGRLRASVSLRSLGGYAFSRRGERP
ncbi:transglutaminaseTgpA domain-containing protein [Agromyces sp. MMS24-K17]|uniref:transglutaminaseTgpA domain-containing protein n=1 Tax=Agromyces sp. MMS24-K17 TaxID=3372850 RepID=UPI003754142E